jgi:hypothetical protein
MSRPEWAPRIGARGLLSPADFARLSAAPEACPYGAGDVCSPALLNEGASELAVKLMNKQVRSSARRSHFKMERALPL